MKTQSKVRDERTIAVENASFRWGYMLLSYGLLAIIAYRGFVWQESNWDLLALVVLSGAVTTAYQGNQQVLTRGWLLLALVTFVLAAIVAAVITLLT